MPNLFDTTTLDNHGEINLYLRNNGFEHHRIATEDHYILDTLFLQRNDAEFTIIICNGLCCVKESMATFYHIFPDNYNICFFDARGHGKSSGSLLKAPWRYGIDDYKDILAIINFVQSKTNTPIILYGSCAGGFNATHALLELHRNNMLISYNIKGFIYDSGWGSRIETFNTAGKAKIDKIAKKIALKYISKAKQQFLATSHPVRILKLLSNHIINFLSIAIVNPLLQSTEQENNLYDKIGMLSIPIFFIHSIDDKWVPFAHAQRLAQSAQSAHLWWITEPSLHSCHHLIHKDDYQKKVTDFCSSLFK